VILRVEATGDQRKLELDDLFRQHYRLVFRTAYAIVGNVVDAEDVAQTIFLRLLRRDASSELKDNPGAYLYRAAVNESLSVIRNRQRRVRREEGSPSLDPIVLPSDTGVVEEMHRRLYEAIAELDAQSAHILVLKYIHDYTDAEIAKLLGKSRTNVAVRLYRSRARLKKLLRAIEGERK
jgi:RNA polymerase sigma-70 factor (ECF subfamily)